MSKKRKPEQIIGRLEHVSFPEWDLIDLDAKVDTGAYTSSLHCHHIEKIGENHIRFNLLDPSHDTYNEKLFKLPIYKEKTVKSSNGITEQRYVVKTKILLMNQLFDIELSLTDRSEMSYPVLLGRKLLKGRFLVDVSRKYLSNKNSKEEIY
ncbi:RimK/LysX family protein [Aliifodinibius sp. S!AR15-10]|uniref:ATP-dependent zinc protease family protein n=1 Tax=Aliifodinibius sp. S!AR15-10 TaxID=2950437 RepID=UPI0028568C93|nr:RimK/LysX family protein [Aliifodinibius sp. S!AR15-10]MDR8390938.1 RimK/LysX family protein [Aliifodinibius sp. S!AR15-10]